MAEPLRLHEAIAAVLAGAREPLTAAQIAAEINRRHLYSRKDGRPVPAGQVHARIRQHPNLFTVHRAPGPQRFSLCAAIGTTAQDQPAQGFSQDWLTIRVDLVSGAHMWDVSLPGTPGRVMLVGPHHSFKDLAQAIDQAFARWDLAHLHEFHLADGRRIGMADLDDYDEGLIDYADVRVAGTVRTGDVFVYVFDLGDNWQHRCRVESTSVDPVEVYGIVPARPVPIWGWGWIPDQYGRRWDGDTGEDEPVDADEDAEF